jgi:predicted DNA binding CopG/RHH family protein
VRTKEEENKDWKDYYEGSNILDKISDEPADITLKGDLRQEILLGKRKRKFRNVTIKVDPLQIVAIKKLSNMKSIPYQTLIRHWLAEGIKHEMDSVLK